ncbi:MAG: hypothetical protein PVSMB7_14680 [Chloroflexota bacterium]
MSDVGKITIEVVARSGKITRHVSAIVNVGGSLVDVECESDQDPELAQLVDHLSTKLSSIALDKVRASLHEQHA